MDMCPDQPASSVRRTQAALCGLVLGVFLMTAGGVDLLARQEAILEWVEACFRETARQNKAIYAYRRAFIDCGDRVALEDMVECDYSRGGVCLIGTSNLAWGLGPLPLAQEQRRLVRNFAIGASNHTAHRQQIDYLIRERGLLRGGGQKVLVVFGLSYHAATDCNGPGSFIQSLWGRHGLYACGPQGLQRLPMGPVQQWLRTEKARCSGFLHNLARLLRDALLPRRPVRQHYPDDYNQSRLLFMGPDWQAVMDQQVGELDELLRQLKSQGVGLMVVLLPQGSWEDKLPFNRTYGQMVGQVCGRIDVPLMDLRKHLDDDDFADSNHLAPAGQDKLYQSIEPLILKHLRHIDPRPPAPGTEAFTVQDRGRAG